MLDSSKIEEELMDYLLTNPESMDTFEGVVEWWIVRSRVRQGIDQVRAALQALESKGLIERYLSQDNTEFYKSSIKSQNDHLKRGK